MPSFGFRWIHPYRPSGGGRPAPLVPARVTIGLYSVDVLLLVDTGAEHTLLDGIHVRAAGGDIFTGPGMTFSGFLGASTIAHAHRIRLQIGDAELERDVHFSTQPLPRQILGRDLLDGFLRGVRELHQECYLEPEPGPGPGSPTKVDIRSSGRLARKASHRRFP